MESIYIKVPIVNGIYQVGTRRLFLGVGISSAEAVCHVEDGPLEPEWVEITEDEFRQYVLEPEPVDSQPTFKEQLISLKEQNLILMDALATTFEEILALRAIVEGVTV